MSLPSIKQILKTKGIADARNATAEEQELVLFEAMQNDLPKAVSFIKGMLEKADITNSSEVLIQEQALEDVDLQKQVLRLMASTAMRQLAEKYITNGLQLSFVNCHQVVIGKLKHSIILEQILNQDGTIAHSDC